MYKPDCMRIGQENKYALSADLVLFSVLKRGGHMNTKMEELQANCDTCPVPTALREELCRICATQQMIRGKWKLMIVWLLRKKSMRFSQLMAAMPNVKQGPLTEQLKELTAKGLVSRTSYNEMPPRVDYCLTEKGKSFLQVLQAMDEWAINNLFP